MAAERDDYADFSDSVREAFGSFDPETEVSGAQLAGALQRLHPDYAGGLLKYAVFTRSDPTRGRTIAAWADTLRSEYDPEAVAASRHGVIDTRLALLGLARLDWLVMAALLDAGALAPLRGEIAQELAPDQALFALEGHTGGVVAVAWSPDGTRLATASQDGTARLWDPTTGRTTATLQGHTEPVWGVAWSPDGTRLATASHDGTARLWDAATGRTTATLDGHTDPVRGVAWSPDGTQLATVGTDRTVRIWDPATGRSVAILNGHTDGVWGVAWSPDGTRLATVSHDGTARLWDPATGRTTATLEGHTDIVEGVAWSPDGTRLATASHDGTARLWDPATGQTLTTLEGHTDYVEDVAWSPDATRLATVSNDGTSRLWDPATGQTLTTLESHTGAVWGVSWSPDGTRLATTSADRTVRLWDSGLKAYHPAPADQTGLVHDEPVDAEHDELNRVALAGMVGGYLRQFMRDEAGTSFLVHVDGPWGSGKSTLLRFIREDLEKSGPWLTVNFDAWRESQAGMPWPALLASLRREVRRSRPGHRWTGLWWLRELPLRFGRARLLATALFLALLAAFMAFLIWIDDDGDGLGTMLATVGAVASLAALGWTTSRGLARFMAWSGSSGSATAFMDRHASPMEAVSQHFRWLVRMSKRPILFVIDDLDRCDNSYVVALLDAVQTLVRDAPTESRRRLRGTAGKKVNGMSLVVIVAADGRWLRQSYEEAHKEFIGAVARPGQPLGYLFVDKLFQLTVTVPTLSPARREQFLASVLGVKLVEASSGEADDQRAATPTADLRQAMQRSGTEEDVIEVYERATQAQRIELAPIALERLGSRKVQQDTERHVLQEYAALLPGNPRSMKRFVMNYGLLRGARTAELSTVSPDHLARWAVVRTRWPGLADHLRARPGDVERIGSEDVGGVPPMLAPLFADADGQVRAVLEPLDAAAIRACTGTGDGGRRAEDED